MARCATALPLATGSSAVRARAASCTAAHRAARAAAPKDLMLDASAPKARAWGRCALARKCAWRFGCLAAQDAPCARPHPKFGSLKFTQFQCVKSSLPGSGCCHTSTKKLLNTQPSGEPWYRQGAESQRRLYRRRGPWLFQPAPTTFCILSPFGLPTFVTLPAHTRSSIALRFHVDFDFEFCLSGNRTTSAS